VRRKKAAEQGNGDRWLLSYAGLFTLLFALFVVLYAQSKADVEKLKKAPQGKVETSGQNLAQARDAIQESLKPEAGVTDVGEKIQFGEDDRGLIVRLAARDFFEAGAVEARADLRPLLDRIAKVLVEIPNPIRVEGHTDLEEESLNSAQSGSSLPSALGGWELSAGRAAWIVKYWIKRWGMDPARLSAAGFSHFHPLAQGKDDYSRGRNRRVEIIILRNPK
jgi:chemotaxis protein MotB